MNVNYARYRYTKGFLKWVDLSWETDMDPSDWVMSFEVGEHIDRAFEGEFIRNIHKLNRKGIVLSWANLGQQGFHHVNTRSPQYVFFFLLCLASNRTKQTLFKIARYEVFFLGLVCINFRSYFVFFLLLLQETSFS